MAELKTDLQDEEGEIFGGRFGSILKSNEHLKYVIKANKIWSECKSQAPSTSQGQSHNVT